MKPINRFNKTNIKSNRLDRTMWFGLAIIVIGVIFTGKLFAIQIIDHDKFRAAALAEHAKKFEIPAPRGTISASDGYNKVPIVLNEDKYLVFADPTYIQDTKLAAKQLQGILGGELTKIEENLTKNSRYVILAKKIDKSMADRIRELKLKGVGLKEFPTRSYPQGTLAAHILGFVNDEGQGQYGLEEFNNQELSGVAGSQTKITDINGVPLAINNKDSQTEAIAGSDINLTIDIRMQKIIEDKLKANVERTQSEIGSAVLIDANNGQIKAMANYPTYDPGQFASIEKQEIFKNIAITGQWEPGSVIKPLVMSTAFNENKINPGSTYFDNGSVQVSDRVIRNSENWGAKTMTMKEVITRSLNVGAVYILKSLGGGQINEQARNIWFDYLNKFNFGKKTNIELAGEQPGYIMKPNDPNGAMVTYATMSFGQGMAVTPLQLAASYVPIANGGTYYQPQIIESQTKNGQTVNKEPKIISENLIRKDVSESVKSMLQSSLEINNKSALRAGYVLGAKSGTAEFVDSGGEYEKGIYNGTYVGFISGKKDNYVLLVRLDKPKTSGYASTQAAVTWAQISNEMLNSIAIEPL